MYIHTIINFFVSLQTSFYVHWDPPSIGIVYKDGSKSASKGDFAIKLDMLVEAGSKTGYLAWVKRAIDCDER